MPDLGLTPAASTHRGLKWALGFSLAVHVGLVSFRFAAPETYNRVFQDTPLEVVLVNARSQERPSQAQVLAQVNLAGGGEVPEVRMATSPLPAAVNAAVGDDTVSLQQKIESLKLQQMRLLTLLQGELAILNRQMANGQQETPDRQALEKRQQLLSQQLARIEQNVEKVQGAPRKRFISPATQEVVYAMYYDTMRRHIEYQGTLNFPEVGGEKIYGQLTMVITVNAQGQLISAGVARASGNPALDAHAVTIVRSSAPFGEFNSKMKAQADQIVVVTRFDFSRNDTLGTRMLSSESGKP